MREASPVGSSWCRQPVICVGAGITMSSVNRYVKESYCGVRADIIKLIKDGSWSRIEATGRLSPLAGASIATQASRPGRTRLSFRRCLPVARHIPPTCRPHHVFRTGLPSNAEYWCVSRVTQCELLMKMARLAGNAAIPSAWLRCGLAGEPARLSPGRLLSTALRAFLLLPFVLIIGTGWCAATAFASLWTFTAHSPFYPDEIG